MLDAKALDGQIPGLPGDDCRRPTPQKHGAELSQEASWVGQRLEREELSVGAGWTEKLKNPIRLFVVSATP